MGLFTRDIKTLEDLFDHGLKDIYYAENQILKALPKLIEAATNPQLKKGLKDHLAETENHGGCTCYDGKVGLGCHDLSRAIVSV